MILQQKGSKFSDKVTTGMYSGTGARAVDYLGLVEMQPVSGRFQPMGRVDADYTSRWITPVDFDLPQLIDSFDKLRALTDPSSMYVQNAVNAANRKKDDIIMSAIYAPAKSGIEGAETTAFPAAQVVAVNHAGANSGLTVEKLKRAKRLLAAAEVDLDTEEIFCAISAAQEENLLGEAQVINLDYNDRPVLMEGRIMRFLGINFIHSERIPVDASGYRRVPMWAKSGLHLGMWDDVRTSISVRHDIQSEPWQAYVRMTLGATRLMEKKVVEIKCLEVV